MQGETAAGTAAVPAPHLALPDEDGPVLRMLYGHAADPEACVPDGGILDEIRADLLRHPPGGQEPLEEPLEESLDDLVMTARVWGAGEAERFRALGDPGDRSDPDWARDVLIRRAVLGCAPLGLTSGAWLQWLTAPGNADAPLALRILALYASDVGVGNPGASRGQAYLELLRRLRLAENAVPVARLTGDRRIRDEAFRLPAVLLLMSRRPEDFTAVLLGADLCLRAVGPPPPLAAVQRLLPAVVDWAALDPAAARRAGEPAPVRLCRSLVDELCVQEGAEAGAAVRRGFTWALAAVRHHTDTVYAELCAAMDPAYEMAELLRLRAREGSVYHHDFTLEGRPLAGWLAECRTDPAPLLAALARSRLVKPGRSESSALVGGLVGARGPMFRVFSPADLTVIRRWIDSLPTRPATTTTAAGAEEGTAPSGAAPPAPSRAVPSAPSRAVPARAAVPPSGPHSPRGRVPVDLREAYHLLMTRAGSPALRDWCLDYVTGWLARSGHGMDQGTMPLPRSWDRAGLRPWLQAQHDRHGAEFQENADIPLPSRDAVIDDTVQTAPLTLIDGSWLRGFTDYELASSEIGHSLFTTYWDELGNGEPGLNHPLIYRVVLKEMGVDLPPTASPEFARWPGFRDASFELPVYWLCVGRFPRTFLPEVLGLNLAMELSGVGGTYRRARLALQKYGFDTRFVDIHNTIDNVATGHSAWAADAVDTLMAGLPEAPGPGSRAEIWERVRVGYRSLNPPSGYGARRAARRGRITGRRQ